MNRTDETNANRLGRGLSAPRDAVGKRKAASGAGRFPGGERPAAGRDLCSGLRLGPRRARAEHAGESRRRSRSRALCDHESECAADIAHEEYLLGGPLRPAGEVRSAGSTWSSNTLVSARSTPSAATTMSRLSSGCSSPAAGCSRSFSSIPITTVKAPLPRRPKGARGSLRQSLHARAGMGPGPHSPRPRRPGTDARPG